VAIYAVTIRVADLIRRLFSPFTESLFVSLCRTAGALRSNVELRASALPWLIVTSGLAIGSGLTTLGGHALTLVFGGGYQKGIGALVVLVAAATLRAMYMPGVRRLQADAALAHLPRWFILGGIAHIGFAVVLTLRWSILGTAISVLLAVAAFEAAPATWALHRHVSDRASLPLAQAGAALAGACALLLLGWSRLSLGGMWWILLSGCATLLLAVAASSQLLQYMRSARSVLAVG
jgi:O-antigen/teichoic acid export membrane protein